MLRASLHEQEIRRVIGVPGQGNRVVDGVAPVDSAEDRCLYFINKNETTAIRESLAARDGCIVIAPTGSALADQLGDCLVLEAGDPRAAIAKVLGFIRDERREPPWLVDRIIATSAIISPLAVVEGQVEIADGVVIEPFCMVGPDVRLGRGSILRSGVRVYPRVSIGNESMIGSNTVIGHQGYGFVRDKIGNKTRIPHLGGVIIGSHVEIGCLSVIQCGTISPTIIEDHVKIGDHVHLGHNDRVAQGASITGGVVIAGSALVGAEAWIGINSSIKDGRHVGRQALVGMDSSVQQDVGDNSVVRAPRPDVRMRLDDDPTSIGFKQR